jgi:hypothetical protein
MDGPWSRAADRSRSPNPAFIGLQNTVAAMLPRCENAHMTTRVEQIAEQVKSLPASEREELLSWLAEYELGQTDSWDAEIARDSQPGGRMQRVLDRVRRDIAEGRTKPLDEVIDNE